MSRFASSLFGCLLAAPLVAPLSSALAAPPAGQFLVHDASGLCVDVAGAPGVNNGAAVRLWTCEVRGTATNGTPTDHRWVFENGFLRNPLSNKCVDVPGDPGRKPGSRLQIWDCELTGRTRSGNPTDQQFDWVNGQFRHRLTNLCIGPERTEYRDGQPLALVACAKPGAADLEFAFRQPPGAAPAAQAAPVPVPAPAPAPAPVAAAAKPRLIYPDVAGASQLCVMPVDEKTRRPRAAAGSRLMLVQCQAATGSAFALDRGRITLAGQPDLCVTVAANARTADLVVSACQGSNVPAWEAGGNATQAARIRVAGGVFQNQCWSAPQLDDPSNPPLPYTLQLKDCGRGDQRWFLE